MGYTPMAWIGSDGGYHGSDDLGMNLNCEYLPGRFEAEIAGLIIGIPGHSADIIPDDLQVNRTLFRDPDIYTLHYSTAFYKGFALFEYNPIDESLTDYCRRQLFMWVRDVQTFKSKLIVEFSADDCLDICLISPSWRGRFHFIDSSNVSDYVNLIPLLLSVRQIAVDNTTIFRTTSMTHINGMLCPGSDLSYLQKNLYINAELWPTIYGWRCLGNEGNGAPTLSMFSGLWPCVSPYAPIECLWIATPLPPIGMDQCPLVYKALDTIITKVSSCDIADKGSNNMILLVPIMLRIFCNPLEVLEQLKLPRIYFGEIASWLSAILCENTSTCPLRVAVKWVRIPVDERQFESTNQPLLRAQGQLSGETLFFSCLSLFQNEYGHTTSVMLLCPEDLDVSTLSLSNVEVSDHVYPYSGSENHDIGLQSLLLLKSSFAETRPKSGSLQEFQSHFTITGSTTIGVENKLPWPCEVSGPVFAKKRFPNAISHSILPSTSPVNLPKNTVGILMSRLFLKKELYESRIGKTHDLHPEIYLKEMTFALLGLDLDTVLYVRDKERKFVSLIVIAERFYQDQINGFPLLKLIVAEPSKPLQNVPTMFRRNVMNEMEYNQEGVRFFLGFVQLLANGVNTRRKTCAVYNIFLPLPFPRRDEMFSELSMIRIFEQSLGRSLGAILNRKPDPEGNLMALKDLGGRLYAQKSYKGASHCFMLGALCLESSYIDDKKECVRDAIAKCHTNLALTQLHGGGSMKLAIRCCGASSSLSPKWNKPWHLLGLCYERQGNAIDAAKAFRTALALGSPTLETQKALQRVLLNDTV